MSRPLRVQVLLPLTAALLTAGCQDYNFNPVGQCLIQPGSERVTLSDLSSADVLFVVDDSGSMRAEQERLAQSFSAFIARLDASNLDRRTNGLDPIDFHVAVTTTSVFQNSDLGAACRTDCTGAAGSSVCCYTSTRSPVTAVRTCAADADCSAGDQCLETCAGHLGSQVCCSGPGATPRTTELISCPAGTVSAPNPQNLPATQCGNFRQHYSVSDQSQNPPFCYAGVAENARRYPQGSFVGAGTNPRVLHFDKELYPPADSTAPKLNRQGYDSAQLQAWFASQATGSWQGNVVVGTCGSGQESALHAAMLAVQKAERGEQMDTRTLQGEPASAIADWLRPNSKLVLVFVGDEDDCASPMDPVQGVVLVSTQPDTCVTDPERKQFPVKQIVDYFMGLGRPVGAAFIVSTSDSMCVDGACRPGLCVESGCSGATCGGQAPATRLIAAADEFRARGADVVVGSICNPNFDEILIRIADIVKPPSGLQLPSQPASSDITVLRIARPDGSTRMTCRGPAPAGATGEGYDWWFTASGDSVLPSPASRFVYINELGTCRANPGETYSADYIGRLPAGGCQTRAECASVLGGNPGPNPPPSWTCYAGVNAEGLFIQPTPETPGSCICGDHIDASGNRTTLW